MLPSTGQPRATFALSPLKWLIARRPAAAQSPATSCGRSVVQAISIALSVSIALVMTSCSTMNAPNPPPVLLAPMPAPPPPPPVAVAPPRAPSKVVKATWYGEEFANHRTATGEPFDPNALTAASKTLPLGTVVKVTNPDNGRSVKVRINDRGPYKRGTGLDLSRKAAQKIGITHKGVARVKVTPVAHETEAGAAPPD
jgi:rare lipoprotein A